MRNKLYITTFIVLICLLGPAWAGHEALKPQPNYAGIAKAFARALTAKHLLHRPVDDTISSMAWTNYLASMDCDHEYFLASDIERFKLHEKQLGDDLKKGDLGFAYEVFQTFEQRVRTRYALYSDGKQVLAAVDNADSETVLQSYLSSFAHAYDPYSEYLSKTVLDEQNIQNTHSLVGVGATLSTENGIAEIAAIWPGGPADRDPRPDKLQPGDRILSVAQGDSPAESTSHRPAQQIAGLIRGKKGTKVVLTVTAADANATPRQVDLIRDEVSPEQQLVTSNIVLLANNEGIPKKLGIIRVPAFYGDGTHLIDRDRRGESSAADTAGILREMLAENIDGVLLDLRNNGGGSTPESAGVAGLFIDARPMGQIVTDVKLEILDAHCPGISYTGPVVVLVDRFTASASELIAGALQDYGRAVIVGASRTYGKGVCQTTYRLGRDTSSGSIKVTNIAYYRVSGESPQCKGICPDIIPPSLRIPERVAANDSLLSTNLPPVHRAGYEPMLNLDPTISKLREDSDKRRDAKTISASGAGIDEDAALKEGLAVLGDLIAIGQKEHLQFYREPPRKSLWQTMTEWLSR
jgi:C-terminal peptidase prc